jgi:hypothetical protein
MEIKVAVCLQRLVAGWASYVSPVGHQLARVHGIRIDLHLLPPQALIKASSMLKLVLLTRDRHNNVTGLSKSAPEG